MFSPLNKSGQQDDGIDIDPARLRVGLFIRLNLRWTEHNFMFNQFRIASDAQVRALQELGLKTITYFPARSIAEPLSAEDLARAPHPGTAPGTGAPAAVADGPASSATAAPAGPFRAVVPGLPGRPGKPGTTARKGPAGAATGRTACRDRKV
ncbi:DUF3391 domain-containing protein [Azoarcus sp. L1K30]|uniref:DUF3391 domain-containing protein n=1 Tax=Azoarcus sp. L1K30 TaxID=2820277 RepID=UPI001B81E6AC|nr:DUF3391 domain-containing protein [Azoarcus sp. L1K30]MBR0564495.1 DUF3391 domain-containing protein [Azoarcus sp. L1K30]